MLPASARASKARNLTSRVEQAGRVSVGPVSLLGVQVTACVLVNHAEHERRSALGLGPVTDPALLGRLLELQPEKLVTDPVFWAETAGLPEGIVGRGDDGTAVTRLLQPPLTIRYVMVPGAEGRELLAVQKASLFASFTARWVSTRQRDIPDAAVMEAKLCGVGLIGPGRSVILRAEQPDVQAADEWSWLLQEKTYRRWLREQTPVHATGSQALATGEASATAAG